MASIIRGCVIREGDRGRLPREQEADVLYCLRDRRQTVCETGGKNNINIIATGIRLGQK